MNANYVKHIKLGALTIILNTVMNINVQANTDTVNIVHKPIDAQQPKIQVPTDAKTILKSKLASLAFFSANFNQVVESALGEQIAQSSGKLAISKPNLANWHTLLPDELAIVSDGNDVWFYDPWIEQVSVYSLSAAIAKTPILLLTSQDESLWQQYTVTTAEPLTLASERFVITSNDINAQIKSLTLEFKILDNKSELQKFSFLDATGQLSHIQLTDFEDQTMPKASMFQFQVPEGVQVDDQRTE